MNLTKFIFISQYFQRSSKMQSIRVAVARGMTRNEILLETFLALHQPQQIALHEDYYALLNEHRGMIILPVSPIVLASVCKSWRVIAISTAHLWSIIHIHINHPSRFSDAIHLFKLFCADQEHVRSSSLFILAAKTLPGKTKNTKLLKQLQSVGHCSLRWPHRWNAGSIFKISALRASFIGWRRLSPRGSRGPSPCSRR